jgi:hypothetical protein
MSTTYKKQKQVTSQLGWYNVLPSYQETINLNLYDDHFSYVSNIAQVAQTGLHCLSGITLRDVAHWNCIPRNVGTHRHAE